MLLYASGGLVSEICDLCWRDVLANGGGAQLTNAVLRVLEVNRLPKRTLEPLHGALQNGTTSISCRTEARSASGNYTWPISAVRLAQANLLTWRESALQLDSASRGQTTHRRRRFLLCLLGLPAFSRLVGGGPAQLPKWAKYGFSRNFRAGQGALCGETATAAAT